LAEDVTEALLDDDDDEQPARTSAPMATAPTAKRNFPRMMVRVMARSMGQWA
jgi:hypothetical protein